nr:MAG TPA: hypothetical protein [Bacteriophage sp.]
MCNIFAIIISTNKKAGDHLPSEHRHPKRKAPQL